jgi:predicted nucleic acid-binding protein
MAATERITMTMCELDRFKVVQAVCERRLKPGAGRETPRILGRDGGGDAGHSPEPGRDSLAMSVLIDTSVWVDHFRNRNDGLIALITTDRALAHPMVLAELACGTPPAPRAQTLRDIGLLRSAYQASLTEVTAFIERESLFGPGCDLVDMVLLASTLMTPGAKLWTLDRRLAELAGGFGIAYRYELHLPRASSLAASSQTCGRRRTNRRIRRVWSKFDTRVRSRP